VISRGTKRLANAKLARDSNARVKVPCEEIYRNSTQFKDVRVMLNSHS